MNRIRRATITVWSCITILGAIRLLLAGLLLVGTTTGPTPALAAEDTPLKITVSIPPQAWFVQRIGANLVQVQILLGPGHSPATYEPTPRQMVDLYAADLFLAAGVPFEQGLLPRLEAMPQGPRIAGPRPVPSEHRHNHHDLDPHTWLDPTQAMAQADSICSALISLAPGSATTFRAGLESLQLELGELAQEIGDLLAPHAGQEFFVFHPSFGHFARAFGLKQIAIENDGHEPGARRLAEVIDRARTAQARVVIVQPQFSHRSAEAVADAIGAEVVALDPLAADYPTNLQHIARTLAEILAPIKSGS